MSQFYHYICNIARQSGNLAIKAQGSALAATANDIIASVNGTIVNVAAGDVDLTGITIEDNYACWITVYADALGTISVGKGIEEPKAGPFLEKNLDRSENKSKAIIGYIGIVNELGAQFVGGTDVLDDADLTVVYVDAFSPLGF